MVEWDRTTGEVWYDILAFSQPNLLLTRLGYPLARRIQKQFALDSAAALVKAARLVHSESDTGREGHIGLADPNAMFGDTR